MKNLLIMLSLLFLALFYSCDLIKDEDDISGDQSPMGEVGVTVSSSSAEIAGVSNFEATVTELTDGISRYSAVATVTNPLIKNIVANFPGVEVNGDVVSINDMQIEQTKEGIKSISGNGSGVLVKYDSKVGDTYPVDGSSSVRTVVSKTGEDDYSYGFYLIKTIQVEQEPVGLKSGGIVKYTYIANHKYGLVGVKVDFDDGTSVTYPVYTSAEN